jgi:amidase
MQLHEYTRFDGLGLAQLLRAGHVSAAELHDAAQRACAAVNLHINAVVELWRPIVPPIDSAAPFAGVPILIKDVAITWRPAQRIRQPPGRWPRGPPTRT